MGEITQTRAEDAIAITNAFLDTERGANIDGDFAGRQIAERVATVQEQAEELLTSTKIKEHDGFYLVLGQFQTRDKIYNGGDFQQAATVLPGYLVLVPSSLVDSGTSFFYPAVVSEDGLKTQDIRLHVLRQPYRQQIRYGSSMILSAAGQSETKGIGEHGRKADDGVEAEHFATLLAAGSDHRVQTAWQSGEHINHNWRKQSGNSVTTEVAKRLFGQDIPQATITITPQQIETGQAILVWHQGMRDEQTGRPETAARDNALVVIQGLGYEALRTSNPQGIDNVRRLIA
ncbi:MAG TPA: hypothetical protein VLF79_02620 [Candidatus Saccharimonadales bacterium]|nr:hypothetical protein [Candidatus Saccharimonadales bacterium]